MLSRPSNEIGNDEEVPRVPHAANDVELALQSLPVRRVLAADRMGTAPKPKETLPQSISCAFGKPCFEIVALGDGKLGEVTASQFHCQAAPACNLDRVLERLRKVLEQRPHLFGRLQVLLFAVPPRTSRIGEYPALVDADPCFVRFEIVTFEEPHIVDSDDRKLHRQRQVDRRLQTMCFVCTSRSLSTEVESLRKDGCPHFGAAFGLSGPPVQQGLTDVASRSGRNCDDSVRVLAQPGPRGERDARATVGHVATSQQPGKMPVAAVVHRQQRQYTGRNAVRFAFERQIDADDRFDPCCNRGAIEADHAKDIGAIGDGDRRHAQSLRPFDERPDPRYAVDERKLGMQIQMDEAGTHERLLPGALRAAALTGAKLRRCTGDGPNLTRASRCARVPYPLWRANPYSG